MKIKGVGYLQALDRPLPTYTGPPWRAIEPEGPVTDAELTDWRARHHATCSDKIARLLCALERDFGA